jgi:hypothetical protein
LSVLGVPIGDIVHLGWVGCATCDEDECDKQEPLFHNEFPSVSLVRG